MFCKICGKEFPNKKTRRGPKKYCSVQCTNKDRKNIGSRKPGRYKKVLVERHHTCIYCKKDFSNRRKKAKYCSKRCSELGWKKNKRSCPICGKSVVRKHGESTTHDNKQIYCSVECRGIAERKPRPNCLICGGECKHWYSRTCSMNCQAEFKRIFHLLRIKKALAIGVQLNPFYNLDACKWFEQYDKDNNTIGKYATNGGEEFVKGYWLDYMEREAALQQRWIS